MIKDDYPPPGDMSYQEWKNIIDRQEDAIGSGSREVSFKEEPDNINVKVVQYYGEMRRRGDEPFLREYVQWFNLKVDLK